MSKPSTRTLPVATTGARGAYSHQAARRFFGHTVPGLTCETPADAVIAVTEGRASHAIVPVENTITGSFPGVAEAFFAGEIAVAGEVVLPVRHCLLGSANTTLEEISVVTSHSSVLSQCRDWLASWGVATEPSKNTAEAARQLEQSGDRGRGVLGSRELADAYGLSILAEGLSDRPDNRTRFLVLAAPENASTTDGARSAIKVGPVCEPRALKTLRIQLESLGAWRVRVPFLGASDGERFLVEFDHKHGAGEHISERACSSLPSAYLGTWSPAA